jgi:flagellar protein FlaI
MEVNEKEHSWGVDIKSDNVRSDVFSESEIVESYSVSEYADINIRYLEETNDYYYQVIEPELDDFEKFIREEISKKLIDRLKYESVSEKAIEDKEKTVRELSNNIIQNYVKEGDSGGWFSSSSDGLSEESIDKIMYYIVNDLVHFGKITAIMNDPNIEDVSCDKPNMPIFVYHSEYRDLMTNVAYDERELKSFIKTLSQSAGKHISISDPLVDGSLPDGSRVQLTLGKEVTADGSNFTIRKFEEIPFTPIDLLDYNTFSLDQLAYLWLAIENNKSLIFAGGTASGKTTSMNSVSLFIPPGSKVITIEDTREITLRHNNWIKSITRDNFGGEDTGSIEEYELLEAALRQRPEYLIVGEIRGEEARTLFQAMNTGHTTYSTMHAESVESAIYRLENPPISVPRAMLQSLDIVCIQSQSFVNNDRVRRNKSITEITGLESQTQDIQTREVFSWDPSRDQFEKSNRSIVLEEIEQSRGWSGDSGKLKEELGDRKAALEYLYNKDIRDYKVVTDIIRAFMLDKEQIMENISKDNKEKLVSISNEISTNKESDKDNQLDDNEGDNNE